MSFTLTQIENKKLWEEFLLAHSSQALFQSWLWGEVEKKVGHTVYRYGIYEGEKIIGIAQVFVVRARRGTFLHVRQGPVFARNSEQFWTEFMNLLMPLARQVGAWFIRVSPMIDQTNDNKELLKKLHFIPAPIHEVDAERCWVLDISVSEENLLMGMRKTTRYEVRRAQKMDVTVQKSVASRDLKYFYHLYAETSKRHGFVAHLSIKEEFEIFAKEDKAILFLGYSEKELVASAIILFYGGQAIYHHGASLPSKAPVSYLIQWEAILEAKKRGIKLYNFYGIAPEDKPNHPWRGITLFKKGFGGREINYIHAQDYAVSPLYVIPKLIEATRRRLRGY